ncbi:MAG: glycosyltransferase family 39 protein [Candidatus Wallbacteria bacterium]|nr:glycosyltransferase family 39 protein [Candidatus Wallbacteria bacterium]
MFKVTAFFCLLFLLSRTVFLDSDLPPPELCQYWAIDEFYYSIPAFNSYHFGSINHVESDLIGHEGFVLNWPEFLFTKASLHMFGNTFFGLRMGAVIAALLSSLMLISILFGRFGKSAAAATALILLCDFQFLVSGRCEEPTIFRFFAMVLLLYIADRMLGSEKLTGLKSLALGLLASGAFLFVYPTSFFLWPAAFCTVWCLSAGSRMRNISLFTFGCVAATAALFFLFHKVHGQPLSEAFLNMSGPYADRVAVHGRTVSGMAVEFLRNLAGFFGSASFRNSPGLLFLFLLSLPGFYRYVRVSSDPVAMLSGFCLVFFFLQSLFLNDYHLRKMLPAMPLAIISIGCASALLNRSREDRAGIRILLHLLFCALFTLLVWHLNSTLYGEYRLPADASRLGLMSLTAVIAASAVAILLRNRRAAFSGVFIVAALALPNLYLDLTRVFLNPEYTLRNAQIAAAPLINDQVCAGGSSFAFRLYNTSIPALNPYRFHNRRDAYQLIFRWMVNEKIAGFSFGGISGDDRLLMDQSDMELTQKTGITVRETEIGLFRHK